MPYIHQRSDWPAFRWDDSALTTILADVRHRQGLLLGRMRAHGFRVQAEVTLSSLTNEIVASSAIEGEALDPREVRSSLARQLGLEQAGLPVAGRDVEGVVEMTLDATQEFSAPMTSDRLFGWHAALFPAGRSGKRRIRVGMWRTADVGPMQVVSGPIGRERVHFEAPHADRVNQEMSRFLDWFNTEVDVDSVLKAAIAHFWFVTIHPFEDGNGRIARTVADMALARSDGSRERFYSMSQQIQVERRAYYLQLESAQRASLDITAWLRWFLECLNRALVTVEEAHSAVLERVARWRLIDNARLNERQLQVLERLTGDFEGNLTTSKYAKLAKTSTDTALRDITELVERGILERNPGGGRSTSYRLADLAARTTSRPGSS